MNKAVKLVWGWGINDVDYPVYKSNIVDGKQKLEWVCPYYEDWKQMIRRCFDRKYQGYTQTYKDCTIDPDWKYLSNYIKWVDSQPNRNWMNCSPDKDLIILDNKHYSPDTVVYIPRELNNFTVCREAGRGKCMLGVHMKKNKVTDKYVAHCSNPFSGKYDHLGVFPTELEAHKAWQAKKHEHACKLAEQQQDPRVAKALRERYAPDKDWTNR